MRGVGLKVLTTCMGYDVVLVGHLIPTFWGKMVTFAMSATDYLLRLVPQKTGVLKLLAFVTHASRHLR
jgi:hypothetical protein